MRLLLKELLLDKKELYNVITHGTGLLLTLISMPYLLYLSFQENSGVAFQSVLIFSMSMMLVYLSSTMYHGTNHPRLKRAFQKLDHICIYYLIAGTYTPFLVAFLPTGMSHFMLYVVWGAAALGTVVKMISAEKWKLASTFFYVAMGWAAILGIETIIESFPGICLFWILVGAIFYSTGVIFYLWKKYTYHHAIWHLFVIGGSISHYIAVYYAVANVT